MKKLFFLLSFVSIYSIASAQEFRGGLLAGVNASQINGDHLSGYDKTGVQIGAFVNREIKNNFEWQLELMYITKGSREPNKEDGSSRLYKATLGYVELPVLLIYNINDAFAFKGGPSIGFLVNSKEEDLNGEFRTSRPFNDIALFVNLGANYQLNDNLHMNFNINLSLSPIRKHPSGATIANGYQWNLGQYNNLLSFSFYYQFDDKKG